MRFRSSSFRAAIAGAVATSAVLASTVTGAATGGGGPVAQTVLGSGSDTTQFMMHALDGLYQFSPGCAQIPTPSGPTPWLDFSCQSPDPANTVTTENYQHDQLSEATFLGSGNGIKQLCKQGQAGVAHIDFARSSRGPGASDCGGLHFAAYARDGISVEAFDASTTAGIHQMQNTHGACSGTAAGTFCLTQADLQGIFETCSITNWSQVGGKDQAISIYTPQPGSGTRSTFDGFLGGIKDSSHCIPDAQKGSHQIPENANSAALLADSPGAIFPFSFGVWSTTVNGANSSKLAAIDNVAATAGTIADGSFPYGRFLYNVTCVACSGPESSTAAINYVGEDGWLCKPAASHGTDPATGVNYRTEIESKITAAGFVPIPTGNTGGGDGSTGFCRLFTTPTPVIESRIAAVTGGDNAVYSKLDSGGFVAENGALVGAPAVVSVPGASGPSPLYIGVGGDHQLYVRNTATTWQALVPAGVGCLDTPGAAVSGAVGGPYTLTVACEGGDRAVYFAQTSVVSGTLPTITSGFTGLGGSLSAGPAVAALSGVMNVFVVDSTGAVKSHTLNPGDGFVAIPAGCIGHVAVASTASTAYLACHGGDGHLYYSVNSGSGWGTFHAGGGVLIDGPGIALTSSAATIYVEGGDTQLYHTVISLDGNTQLPYALDGGGLQHGAAAAGLRLGL